MQETLDTHTSRFTSIDEKLAWLMCDDAHQMHRIDLVERRLRRIETRLDLHDPEH